MIGQKLVLMLMLMLMRAKHSWMAMEEILACIFYDMTRLDVYTSRVC